VEYYGMTAGAHYTLYTDTKSNDSSSPLYTRWLTFSLSAINGLNFTVTNKESGTKWSGKGSQKILGEISLIDFVVGRVRISLIEIASIPNGSLEYSSPVEIENLNMLYIFGLGMVF
jgi:hypothetical protein